MKKTKESHLLFSYGTLQLNKVQLENYGRLLIGEAENLFGYKIEKLKITDLTVIEKSNIEFHPIAIKSDNTNDFIEGTIFEITEAELVETDKYEVSDYQRIYETFASGKKAWIYVGINDVKTDIKNIEDLELLVDTFYSEVKENKILGYIFNDVAKINWVEHLPRMYSFWASILLGDNSFSGNPMEKHITLSKVTPITEKEFNEWLLLFRNTVNKLFIGTAANEAKLRASNIARIMLYKIQTK